MNRILCIDDDSDGFHIVKEQLRELATGRYLVEHVRSIEEAKVYLRLEDYDLFIVDYCVRGSDNNISMSYIQSLLWQPHCPPVLLLTGVETLQTDAQTLEWVDRGLIGFLAKDDLTTQILEASLQRCLRRRRRVLVVDDDVDDFTLIETYLQNVPLYKYQVFHAADRVSAQEQLSASTFDVVIIDFRLGPERGTDLARWIWDQQITTSLILLTGMDCIPLNWAFINRLRQGEVGFLHKSHLSADNLCDSMQIMVDRDMQRRSVAAYAA